MRESGVSLYYCISLMEGSTMKRLKTLVRRTAGLCLAVLLTVPVLAAEPLDPAKRQEDLDIFYEEVLMKGHPNAFANASEAEFLAL